MNKRTAQTLAASIMLLAVALFMIFRPNGDVAAFIQHPATAAWVQSIGSVVAIAAAIWIDQGTARRARDAERRVREQAARDWEQCLTDVVQLGVNSAALAERQPIGELRNPQIKRLIDNAIMMVDTYLRQPPPNTRLAFALASARSHLEVPSQELASHHALNRKRGVYAGGPTEVARLKAVLSKAAHDLTNLEQEYVFGAW